VTALERLLLVGALGNDPTIINVHPPRPMALHSSVAGGRRQILGVSLHRTMLRRPFHIFTSLSVHSWLILKGEVWHTDWRQRSCEPHKQAEHMAATDQLHREENPCQQGAVHTWHISAELTQVGDVSFRR
jgi:hypothetical protein